MHVQPYWSRKTPGAIPGIRDKAAARRWLTERDSNGWTPLIEEAFKGRAKNVLDLVLLAKFAYGNAGLREYVRLEDDLNIDACGWARLHRNKNWQVIDLLTICRGY